MKSIAQSQRGASAVEFAVIAPLFIALLFAIAEFGMILYTKGMLAHATREGARVGVVYCSPRVSDANIISAVQDYLNQVGLTSSAVVTVARPDGAAEPQTGKRLNVTATYTYSFMVLPKNINNYGLGTMSSINLNTQTVMRME